MTDDSVFAVTPTNEEWIPDDIGPANTLVALHGGKYIGPDFQPRTARR